MGSPSGCRVGSWGRTEVEKRTTPLRMEEVIGMENTGLCSPLDEKKNDSDIGGLLVLGDFS
jgi:hypothetical protein